MVEIFLPFETSLLTNGILPVSSRAYIKRNRKSFMGDEQTLLTGLHNLEPQAITRIHETYFPVVYRYAQYRLGDETVAEDLASETFIRLLEASHAGRGPRTSLRGWLMGTVSNLVNDYFRVVYSKPMESLQEELPSQNGNPVLHSEQSDRQEVIRAAMLNLTPEQQHVLALRFGGCCSLAETAEIMKKNPNAIKQMQFRALKTLRKHIQGKI
jgi:RNA polymerase sigma-70 factor (ECF subfamily)